MRKKANHLLEFISDKSDVKDALSHWEAEAELYGEEDADMSTQSQENAHPRGLEGPLADGGREEGEDRGSTVNGLGANGISEQLSLDSRRCANVADAVGEVLSSQRSHSSVTKS